MNTALEGGEGSASRPGPPFTPGKDTLSIVHEVGWAQGPVWTGAENLAPTGIRSPDRPAPSQSLYRLSYSALEPESPQLIKYPRALAFWIIIDTHTNTHPQNI